MSQRKNVRLILPMLVLAVAFINNSPNGSANHISVENFASDFKQTRSSAVHVVRRAFLRSCVLCYTWHVTEQRTVITVTWLGVALLMGTQNFLCPTLVTRRKTSFFISLPSSKLTLSLIFLSTNTTLSTLLIPAVCRTRVIWTSTSLAVVSLRLSGRASERRIRRSKVRFLMGTQNLSLFHARDKTKKTLSSNYHFARKQATNKWGRAPPDRSALVGGGGGESFESSKS